MLSRSQRPLPAIFLTSPESPPPKKQQKTPAVTTNKSQDSKSLPSGDKSFEKLYFLPPPPVAPDLSGITKLTENPSLQGNNNAKTTASKGRDVSNPLPKEKPKLKILQHIVPAKPVIGSCTKKVTDVKNQSSIVPNKKRPLDSTPHLWDEKTSAFFDQTFEYTYFVKTHLKEHDHYTEFFKVFDNLQTTVASPRSTISIIKNSIELVLGVMYNYPFLVLGLNAFLSHGYYINWTQYGGYILHAPGIEPVKMKYTQTYPKKVESSLEKMKNVQKPKETNKCDIKRIRMGK